MYKYIQYTRYATLSSDQASTALFPAWPILVLYVHLLPSVKASMPPLFRPVSPPYPGQYISTFLPDKYNSLFPN